MCRLRAKHTSVCKAAVVWQNCQLLADIANKICQYYFLNYNAISANGSMTKQPHDKLLLRGRKKKGKWREIERRRQLFNCAWIIRIRRFVSIQLNRILSASCLFRFCLPRKKTGAGKKAMAQAEPVRRDGKLFSITSWKYRGFLPRSIHSLSM